MTTARRFARCLARAPFVSTVIPYARELGMGVIGT
jgi:hypothetical protein